MLKLHQIFLTNLAALLGIILVALLGVSYYHTKKIDVESLKDYLPKNMILVESILQSKQTLNELNKSAISIKNETSIRITVIDENGTVIIETDKNPTEMANHLNRPEIMQAMGGGNGVSVRHSTSTGQDYIYYAKKTKLLGNDVFLRVAHQTTIVEGYLYSVWYKIGIVLAIAALIGIFFSHRVNKKIEYQINQITAYLKQIEAKNFKAEIRPSFASEFFSIAKMLKILALKLEKKERQKRKYTAKLKLKNKQTTEIIEAISHEFKNPVSAIMGYTETLLNDPDIDKKISQKFLEKVYKNSQSISTMIDRLSLSLKFENGSLVANFDVFDVMDIVEDAKNQLSHKYPKQIIEVSGKNINVEGDKTMIRMALVNLVDNALKYSEENVKITITAEDGYAKIEVTDFGLGIPEREIENITQKFYRLSKNSWDNSLGLGLALVSYILKLHSTELLIDSKVAMGSTFGFKIKQA